MINYPFKIGHFKKKKKNYVRENDYSFYPLGSNNSSMKLTRQMKNEEKKLSFFFFFKCNYHESKKRRRNKIKVFRATTELLFESLNHLVLKITKNISELLLHE